MFRQDQHADEFVLRVKQVLPEIQFKDVFPKLHNRAAKLTVMGSIFSFSFARFDLSFTDAKGREDARDSHSMLLT